MKTNHLLRKLHELGVSLVVENESLRILGKKETLTPALLYEIKALKNELIFVLTNPDAEPDEPPLPEEAFQKLVNIAEILIKMDKEIQEAKKVKS